MLLNAATVPTIVQNGRSTNRNRVPVCWWYEWVIDTWTLEGTTYTISCPNALTYDFSFEHNTKKTPVANQTWWVQLKHFRWFLEEKRRRVQYWRWDTKREARKSESWPKPYDPLYSWQFFRIPWFSRFDTREVDSSRGTCVGVRVKYL